MIAAVLFAILAVFALPLSVPRHICRELSRFATRGAFAHYVSCLQTGARRSAARISPRIARHFAVWGPVSASLALWLALFVSYAGPVNHSARIAVDSADMFAARPVLDPFDASEALERQAAAEENLGARGKRTWQASLAVNMSGLDNPPSALAAPGRLRKNGGIAAQPSSYPVLFSMSGGLPVSHGISGSRSLALVRGNPLAGSHAPYDDAGLMRIATGEQGVEVLLDKLRQEQTAPELAFASASEAFTGPGPEDPASLAFMPAETQAVPVFEYGDPAAGIGLICRSDRMELAAWLREVRANSLGMAPNYIAQASKYSDYVERFSSDYALSPSLVYAIMRIESSFNPRAVSIANALGLMQVVPQTAGGEVHAYLFGKRGIPARETLFTPEDNIRYGTTYLYLLNNKHFKEVENHLSRELCIIAAYNGGPGAVYRVFNRDRDKALERINLLSPDELYATLVKRLPAQETRDYVVKVVEARNRFRYSEVKF